VTQQPLVRPLLVTADGQVLDDLLRLPGAPPVRLEVAADVPSARRAWSSAPLVLVGSDLAPDLARRPPPRREDVILVGGDLDDARVWRRGVRLGGARVVF